MQKPTPLRLLIGMGLVSLLSACDLWDGDGNSNDDADMAMFEVKVVNATAGQPLSPLFVVVHDAKTSLWQIGSEASVALEKMAEGGDNSDLIKSVSSAYGYAVSADKIGIGDDDTFTFKAKSANELKFSAATMLVKTNDAFAGINSVDISDLAKGESISWALPLYDAGTEPNSEAAGTIPGVSAGEGFNADRPKVMNKVSRHPGLVTQADDPSSVLMAEHRVIGAAAILTLTRE